MIRWLHDICDAAPAGARAIIDHDGTELSYGDLRAQAAAAAGALAAHGVRPGDRVMLVAENCAAFAVMAFALSRAGAWVLPVNARHSAEELDAVAAHSGARCLAFTAAASPAAAEHAARCGADRGIGGTVLTGAAGCDPEPVPDDPAERVAAVLYTTGTTSAPKGVMLSHANLVWNAQSSAWLRELVPGDIVLGVLPGSHIFGFSSTMLAAFHAGATARFLPRFTPEAVLAALAAGASAMPAVPQMYERILTHLHRTGSALVAPRLRYISAGGAPLDPALKARTEAAFGLPLNNGYGITECSPTVAATRPAAPRGDVSAGPALPGVEIWAENADACGVGELIVRSPGVMRGYYRDTEATAAALPEPGVFRTGDLGRIDPDGSVHVLGRVKELIIRSGFNVYPPEIEAMLTRHRDVLQAAVVPRATGGNEEVLAFVMARPGLTESALAGWLRDRLAPYKQPQHILIVGSFPTAPTGKVLKHRLVTHFADLLAARTAPGSGRRDNSA